MTYRLPESCYLSIVELCLPGNPALSTAITDQRTHGGSLEFFRRRSGNNGSPDNFTGSWFDSCKSSKAVHALKPLIIVCSSSFTSYHSPSIACSFTSFEVFQGHGITLPVRFSCCTTETSKAQALNISTHCTKNMGLLSELRQMRSLAPIRTFGLRCMDLKNAHPKRTKKATSSSTSSSQNTSTLIFSPVAHRITHGCVEFWPQDSPTEA